MLLLRALHLLHLLLRRERPSDPPSVLLRAGTGTVTVNSLIIETGAPIENGDFGI
jgi:hypothetical protein